MNLQLNGKLALVSGSTAGIGYAIARTLAAEGAAVIVNGRRQDAVDEAAQDTAQRFPGIGILVNNLGIFEPKPFEDIADEDWRRFFDVNVLSGVRLARLVLPGMRRANWG